MYFCLHSRVIAAVKINPISHAGERKTRRHRRAGCVAESGATAKDEDGGGNVRALSGILAFGG